MILAVLASLCAVGTGCKRPVVSSPAKARVNNMVNRILTAAVNKAVDRGIVDYGALISLEKDEAGRVTALHTNMGEVNCLRALIEEDVLQRLGEVSSSDLPIPLGTLAGSPLLAGRGLAIQVRMQAAGSVSAAFHNEFSAAINQASDTVEAGCPHGHPIARLYHPHPGKQ